jgi:hypothetical protein
MRKRKERPLSLSALWITVVYLWITWFILWITWRPGVDIQHSLGTKEPDFLDNRCINKAEEWKSGLETVDNCSFFAQIPKKAVDKLSEMSGNSAEFVDNLPGIVDNSPAAVDKILAICG